MVTSWLITSSERRNVALGDKGRLSSCWAWTLALRAKGRPQSRLRPRADQGRGSGWFFASANSVSPCGDPRSWSMNMKPRWRRPIAPACSKLSKRLWTMAFSPSLSWMPSMTELGILTSSGVQQKPRDLRYRLQIVSEYFALSCKYCIYLPNPYSFFLRSIWLKWVPITRLVAREIFMEESLKK